MIRPLRRIGPGVWRSRDGRWTFLRHQGDPHPQRWFAYLDDDAEPIRFDPPTTLRDTVADIGEYADAYEMEQG